MKAIIQIKQRNGSICEGECDVSPGAIETNDATFPSFSLSAEQVENAGDAGWLPICWENDLDLCFRFVGDSCDDARRKYAKPTDEELKRWGERQKKLYKAGKLSPERIAKLEAIPGWQWE